MKKFICILTLLALLSCTACFAAGSRLTCKGCKVDGKTTLNFDGTQTFIAVAENFDDIAAWRLNGEIQPGQTYYYFEFTVSSSASVEALTAAQLASATGETATDEPESKQVVVKAIGATLQYLNGQGKGAGVSYTEIDFTNDYKNPVTGKKCKGGVAAFKVTPNDAHSSKINYWVINGVRYNFYNPVTHITVSNLKESMTIEVVYRGRDKVSETLLTEEEIQAQRTDKKLVVKSVNAKFSFVKNLYDRVGAYMTSLDFTNDYKNPETKKVYKGGSCDIKVTATVDEQLFEKVKYWKFNEAIFVFSTNLKIFSVQGLNRSMTYSAVISKNWVPGSYD